MSKPSDPTSARYYRLSLMRVALGAALAATFSLILGVVNLGTTSLAKASESPLSSKRERVIDFEDDLVEGLNKRPLDSLNQISERDRGRRKRHLYRKRAGFRSETAVTISDLKHLSGGASR